MKDTQEKLSHTTIALHWLVGLGIIGLIAVGIYMEQTKTFSLYPLHKSMGIIILGFIVARIIWRMINGWPKPVGEAQSWENTLGTVIHWVLIIGTLLFPVSGMMMSGAGGHGLAVFGLELLPANIVDGEFVPLNGELAGMAHNVHGILGNVMIIAVILHVAGALKHHFIKHDRTLVRMLGKSTD